jgi:hypothetical protein
MTLRVILLDNTLSLCKNKTVFRTGDQIVQADAA